MQEDGRRTDAAVRSAVPAAEPQRLGVLEHPVVHCGVPPAGAFCIRNELLPDVQGRAEKEEVNGIHTAILLFFIFLYCFLLYFL